MRVHGQVRGGELDLPCPPRPVFRIDFLFLFVCLFWDLAGLEL